MVGDEHEPVRGVDREGVERDAVEVDVARRAAREHVDERVRLGRVGQTSPTCSPAATSIEGVARIWVP